MEMLGQSQIIFALESTDQISLKLTAQQLWLLLKTTLMGNVTAVCKKCTKNVEIKGKFLILSNFESHSKQVHTRSAIKKLKILKNINVQKN